MTAEISVRFRAAFHPGCQRLLDHQLYANLREQYGARCAAGGHRAAVRSGKVAEDLTGINTSPAGATPADRQVLRPLRAGAFYREHADEVLKDLDGVAGEATESRARSDAAHAVLLRRDGYSSASGRRVVGAHRRVSCTQHGARSTTPLLGESHGDLHAGSPIRFWRAVRPRVLDLRLRLRQEHDAVCKQAAERID